MHRFSSLNANTKLDVFLLPHIGDFLDKLGKAKYFISIDLAMAYHQVRRAKGNTHKTAFLASNVLYDYVVMLFGLCYAPETFQRLMNLVFVG